MHCLQSRPWLVIQRGSRQGAKSSVAPPISARAINISTCGRTLQKVNADHFVIRPCANSMSLTSKSSTRANESARPPILHARDWNGPNDPDNPRVSERLITHHPTSSDQKTLTMATELLWLPPHRVDGLHHLPCLRDSSRRRHRRSRYPGHRRGVRCLGGGRHPSSLALHIGPGIRALDRGAVLRDLRAEDRISGILSALRAVYAGRGLLADDRVVGRLPLFRRHVRGAGDWECFCYYHRLYRRQGERRDHGVLLLDPAARGCLWATG